MNKRGIGIAAIPKILKLTFSVVSWNYVFLNSALAGFLIQTFFFSFTKRRFHYCFCQIYFKMFFVLLFAQKEMPFQDSGHTPPRPQIWYFVTNKASKNICQEKFGAFFWLKRQTNVERCRIVQCDIETQGVCSILCLYNSYCQPTMGDKWFRAHRVPNCIWIN